MTALAFLVLYRLVPIFAGQLALREFARRGGRPVPAWSATRCGAAEALRQSQARNGDLGWQVVMAGYVDRLESSLLSS